MGEKRGNIVRRSAAELEAMESAGHIRTDWRAAAEKPIPDGSDPDDAMEPVEWATTELPPPPRKEHTKRSFVRKAGAIRPG